MSDARPIGVFDSGLGGLTVLRTLRAALPGESTVYLGDTARVPYGTRSADTVVRYALNNARTLVETADIKLLVIACNTASAVALEALAAFPVPVVGVIEPGARAALAASDGDGAVVVLGTAGTVRSGAYERALRQEGFRGRVEARACPLFVPLVEEGWVEGPVPEEVARRYLDGLSADVRTVVLGCTHYPLLRSTVEAVLPRAVTVVDGGAATAAEVAALLEARGLAAPGGALRHRVLVTDAPEQVAALGPRFLGGPLLAEPELIDVVLSPELAPRASGAGR